MIPNLQSLQITSNKSIREAMKQLDDTAEKVLFVIDKEEKAIGSITDGDIRRFILNGGALDKEIKFVCNTNFIYTNIDYNSEDIKKIMVSSKIDIIPVLNSESKITEYLIWNHFFSEKTVIKKKAKLNLPVVIMAGGKGTRLDPFTKILPKPLIPIGDKTILELIIDKFLDYEIKDFYLSVNHKAKIIKSYFDELNPSYNLQYVHEEVPSGTAGALRNLIGIIDSTFFVSNCDIIISADYSDILNFHKSHNYDLTLIASLKHYSIPYGTCEVGDKGELIEIKEKPSFDFLVNTGMYILESDILNLIPKETSFHMTDLIESLKQSGKKVGVYPISEKSWIDTGEWEEYKNALNRLVGLGN
jgi:dTDP-glucose pyrophosphorylase/predicted transcriptional regulator